MPLPFTMTERNLVIKPKIDCLGRNVGKAIGDVIDDKITYLKYGDHATNIPASIKFKDGNTISYKYDRMGNICAVYENEALSVEYEYDKLGRLVRENNKKWGETDVIKYDNKGNLISYGCAQYTKGDIEDTENIGYSNYTYDDKNRLVGSMYSYTDDGRCIKYRGETVTWDGKNMIGFGTNTFTYDVAGRRTSKNSIVYTYDVNGRLISQSNGISYIYDHEALIGFEYEDNTYFYRRDLLGNIIAILDSTGNIVVNYIYDAWGRFMIRGNSTIGNINPYRYRGYYWDQEIGLYFLQTRYYDPNVGRFISADDVSYIDPETIGGTNLFAYCNNNPVMNVDPSGTFSWKKFWQGVGMVATAVSAIALSVTTFGAGIPLAMSIVAGVTLGTGVLTGVNGVATMIEAGTEYNFVRDGIFNNIGLSDSAYNVYAGITETVAVVGSMVLGFYHTTGQYKAAKYGQKYLGRGYKKAGYTNAGTPRYVSKDGLRQMRFDSPHMYKGTKIGKHLNLELFRGTNPIPYEHILYNLFKYWIL